MNKAPIELRFAVVAVDVPVFALLDGVLHVLVSEVNKPPHYINMLAFLGGIIDESENTDEAATRILKEKGNLNSVYLEQLYTFSNVNRDKRNRVVSVAYIGLVKPEVAEAYKHSDARFVAVIKLPKLAYDHNEMLKTALARLQGKLSYTSIAQHLLPRTFTLTELQTVYETILQREFDKRNFRKKILTLDVLEETGEMQAGVKNRPAALYRFKSKQVLDLPLF